MISAAGIQNIFNAAVQNSAANQFEGKLSSPTLTSPSVPEIDVDVYNGDKLLQNISRDSKSRMISKLDSYSRDLNSKVEFNYDESSNQMIVMSRDPNGRITKQYPAEGLINLRARAREFIGELLTRGI